MPVRALGKCGGYDSDIIAGIQWAVGLSVTGVPDNPYPADIVNLSLGGSGACPASYQSTIDTLTAMEVLVVASAGNQSGPVDAPGNCTGVLAVAGLRNIGTKVGYSSLGAEVGVAAPAGNCVQTSGACLRSIDTTTNTGLTVPAASSYTNETNPNLGTSFSAPIVSGVAALMRSVNANLTPAQLIARIESSAGAFPHPAGLPVCPAVASDGSGECACTAGQCGAGMVNALNAVKAALAPIAAVTLPAHYTTGVGVFNASASVAACGATLTSYAWASSGGVHITGGATTAQATVTSSGAAGTLTLIVMDAAGNTDSALISFSSSGAATTAPSAPGTAASACLSDFTFAASAPTVSESFEPASVSVNTTTTLTFTIGNTNPYALTQATFNQPLPANLLLVAAPAPSTTCTGAALQLGSSGNGIALSGANIPAAGSCAVTLTVKSTTAATYTDTVAANALTTGPAGGNAASDAASLTVTAPSGGGGGGEWDVWDGMFVIGVLLAGAQAPTASAVIIEFMDQAAPRCIVQRSVKTFRDARGALFEPLSDAELAAQKNVHVVLTQPNEIRGNHCHLTAIETTTIVGPCLVRLKEDGDVYDLHIPADEIWRLTIPPGVVHAFQNTGNAVMVLVSFSTHRHDGGGADMRREQIL